MKSVAQRQTQLPPPVVRSGALEGSTESNQVVRRGLLEAISGGRGEIK